MLYQIQLRRDTLANWNRNNPVLLEAEVGIILGTDPIRYVIGDGSSRFSDLPIYESQKVGGNDSTIRVTLRLNDNWIFEVDTDSELPENWDTSNTDYANLSALLSAGKQVSLVIPAGIMGRYENNSLTDKDIMIPLNSGTTQQTAVVGISDYNVHYNNGEYESGVIKVVALSSEQKLKLDFVFVRLHWNNDTDLLCCYSYNKTGVFSEIQVDNDPTWVGFANGTTAIGLFNDVYGDYDEIIVKSTFTIVDNSINQSASEPIYPELSNQEISSVFNEVFGS